MDLVAKQATGKFLAEASLEKLLKQEKPKAKESWPQFMHNQMTCVHKVFVYYTGYKTGIMRQEFLHWAFGIIYVDPNEPYRAILPNAWTFHGHNPWLRRRGNGKDGEWHLMKKYTANKAPGDFLLHVKSWASTLRPGSMLAVAVREDAVCFACLGSRQADSISLCTIVLLIQIVSKRWVHEAGVVGSASLVFMAR